MIGPLLEYGYSYEPSLVSLSSAQYDWAQVLKAKYFSHMTMFESAQPFRSSHIWKALYDGMKWL